MWMISSPTETSLTSVAHGVAGVTEAANGVAGVTEAANGMVGVTEAANGMAGVTEAADGVGGVTELAKVVGVGLAKGVVSSSLSFTKASTSIVERSSGRSSGISYCSVGVGLICPEGSFTISHNCKVVIQISELVKFK